MNFLDFESSIVRNSFSRVVIDWLKNKNLSPTNSQFLRISTSRIRFPLWSMLLISETGKRLNHQGRLEVKPFWHLSSFIIHTSILIINGKNDTSAQLISSSFFEFSPFLETPGGFFNDVKMPAAKSLNEYTPKKVYDSR